MYINDLPNGLRHFAENALFCGTICCDEDAADF